MVVITDLTTVFWTIVFGNLVMVGLMLLVISSTANQILDEIRGLKNQIGGIPGLILLAHKQPAFLK